MSRSAGHGQWSSILLSWICSICTWLWLYPCDKQSLLPLQQWGGESEHQFQCHRNSYNHSGLILTDSEKRIQRWNCNCNKRSTGNIVLKPYHLSSRDSMYGSNLQAQKGQLLVLHLHHVPTRWRPWMEDGCDATVHTSAKFRCLQHQVKWQWLGQGDCLKLLRD